MTTSSPGGALEYPKVRRCSERAASEPGRGSGKVVAMALSADQLDTFLSGRDDGVRALTLASRALVQEVFPDAVETAEGNDLGYGFDAGYKGLVFTISLVRDGVNVGVFRGASMEDPAGLLEGTGKVHRHIKIRSESDLSDDLGDLLTRALDLRRAET
jgi:hypothetical protein